MKNIFKTSGGVDYLIPFIAICLLFFISAFCNSMIDSMDKLFQNHLKLSKAQSAWVQFSHYLGYFLMALPAGWITRRLGYKKGIIMGFLIVAIGCFWFVPATKIATFWAFLLGVCIVAMGLTFLETIANPYATILGDPRYASTRINLAQSFNGLGWPLGPLAGGFFFYGTARAHGSGLDSNQTLWIPYAGIGVAALLLSIGFFYIKLPEMKETDRSGSIRESRIKPSFRLVYGLLISNLLVLSLAFGIVIISVYSLLETSAPHVYLLCLVSILTAFSVGAVLILKNSGITDDDQVWSYPHFSAATLAQFFYVAAQAGIFAFFINYVTEEAPPLSKYWSSSSLLGGSTGTVYKTGNYFITDFGATKIMSFAFGLFVIGRFAGSYLLTKFLPNRLLGLYGAISATLCFLVYLKLGWLSFFSLLGSFFFMSIMYPTIFALGIAGLGEKQKLASSYIVMAIMGGAIIPKLMGWIGDHDHMSKAFVIPIFCFLMVAIYGFYWNQLSGIDDQFKIQDKR